MGYDHPDIPYCETCGAYILHGEELEERNEQIFHRFCGTAVVMIPDSPGDQYD